MKPFKFPPCPRKPLYILFILILLSVSASLFFPDTSSATVSKKITSLDTEGKLKSPSEMFIYFASMNGLNINNYSETRAMVKKGQTLVHLLKPHGLTHAAIFESAKVSKKVFDVRKIRSGRFYSVIKDRKKNNPIRYFIYEKNAEHYVVFDFGKPLKVHAARKKIELKTRQAEGAINTTIYDTALQLNLTPKLIKGLKSIFRNTLNLKNLHKGDRLKVAYQEKYILNKSVGIGQITAAVIQCPPENYQAYHFTINGKAGYYDEKGNSLEKSFLKSPLKYRKITSGFCSRRLHPVKNKYQSHPGVDFAAPRGTPVKCVGDGVVIFKGYSKSAGNYIKINHPGTGISEYLHFSRFHPSIKKNKKVSKGDIIGYVGSTGCATGPHLDLRFMVNGRYVDYRKLKLPDGTPISEEEKPMFMKQIALINSQWKQTTTKISLNANYDAVSKFDSLHFDPLYSDVKNSLSAPPVTHESELNP